MGGKFPGDFFLGDLLWGVFFPGGFFLGGFFPDTQYMICKKKRRLFFKLTCNIGDLRFKIIFLPIYGFSSVPKINMIKQKKSITTIFEHVFLYLFFRPSCEEVHLKKAFINFLNLAATFTFSTSVFHIMCKSSYGFHFICSLNKMK